VYRVSKERCHFIENGPRTPVGGGGREGVSVRDLLNACLLSTVADSTQQLPGKGGKGKEQAERSLEGDEETGTTVE